MKRSGIFVYAVLVFVLNCAVVNATPNTTPGTINCTDLTRNRVIGFNILDQSQDPVTQGVTNFVGSKPYVIDLNKYVNCDMNIRAILDTPVPANCDINNIRCVRFFFGNVTRRDFVPPYTAYLEFGGTGLPIDRVPEPGLQTLKACPYTDPNCQGRNRGCYEVQVDVKACNNPVPAPAPVPAPTPDCTCPVPAPIPAPLPVLAPVPVPLTIPPPATDPVPAPIPAPLPITEPVPLPVPVAEPVPAPLPVIEPVPLPVPLPESVPVPTPAEEPVPIPAALPVPIPAPLPVPIPAPLPVPIPAPLPVPIPAPLPVPIPAPLPVPIPASLPILAPEPVPVLAPVLDPAPLPVSVPLPVPVPVSSDICVFTIGEAFGNPEPPEEGGSFAIDVTITIEPLALNAGVQITVTVTDTDAMGDLRGLFFDVRSSFTLGPASAITGTEVTDKQVSDNNVINLGGGSNMNGNGNKKYDVGVEIGDSGVMGGLDDFPTTVIVVAWPGLTLADLCGQAFGVRLTTSGPIGDRSYSSKIFGQSCVCPPTPPVAPVPVAPVPVPVPVPLAMGMGDMGRRK